MLKEFEFFHGVVLARILHGSKSLVRIKNYSSTSNSSYIVNDNIGLYIKYSTKRMSPWRFSFLKSHQDEIQEMKDILRQVFVVFVCNDDGIVCLNFEELKEVLDNRHELIEWISVSRGPKEKYEIKGSDGKLRLKIGNSDFPQKIFS
jgi:hypothetical protein